MSPRSPATITAGFILVLVLMFALVGTGLSRLGAIRARMDHIVLTHNVEIDLMQSMRDIVRSRSMSLYLMYLTDDPFAREEEFLRFTDMAARFIELRRRFEASNPCNDGTYRAAEAEFCQRRRGLYESILALIRRSQPLQVGLVERVVREDRGGVWQEMLHEDLPLEREILARFDALIELSRRENEGDVAAAAREYRAAVLGMALLGLAAIALGAAIAWYVTRRTRRVEEALAREKERAEVTLHSVGDAVITTDAAGGVLYLNPIAEQLTGWRAVEARGRPLGEIYRLADEQTGEACDLPVASGPPEGRVAVARDAVLLGRDGREYAVEDSAAPIRDAAGRVTGTVLVFRDVTPARRMEKLLTWQATRDPLTGLANRREFEQLLSRLLANSKEQHKQHALLYLDLDQFKVVNDTCGHVAGDELLKRLTAVMQPLIRDSDTLVRLGGDEFGVLLEGCSLEQAERIAHKLREGVQEFRFAWQDRSLRVGVSIGIVAIGAASGDANGLLSAADAACYLAKDKGRNRVWVHREADAEVARQAGEMQWVARLNRAFDEERFRLHFQRVVPLAARGRAYCEVLVRMLDEDGQVVLPMAFIPAAERYGLMPALDRWVVRTALAWLAPHPGEAGLSLNLSGQSLAEEGFLGFVTEQFRLTGLAPARVCFEITETAAVSNWTRAREFIGTLRARGCRFALDDFGSGMSSFAYLKNLPVDYIKIDGAFVRDVTTDPMDRAVIESIHRVAHVLGVETVAEGVEDDGMLRALLELGVDYAQGSGLHEPEPLGEAVFELCCRPRRGEPAEPA